MISPEPQASLPKRMEALAREAALWTQGERILVALSGGADSVALLHLLAGCADREGLELVAAHVNYGLRGEESDGDEAFCRALCEALGVELRVLKAPVAPHGNLQAWARRVRHEWFTQLARELPCHRIAFGHTACDRAETVILQMMRGASRRGVANMKARSGRLIRPLITTERASIEDYLRHHGVAFRTDSSNASPKYRRNRVRHEVLPLLSDVFEKNAVASLSESAKWMSLEADYLELETARHRHLLEPACGGLRIALAPLLILHPALSLHLLGLALTTLNIRPGRERLFRLLDLAARPAGKRIEMGKDGRAERGRTHLWLYKKCRLLREVPVSVPGVTALPDGSVLRVERTDPAALFPRGDYQIATRLNSPPDSLRIRPARAGDRIRPFGGKGSRLVFDLLSEAGVPRFLRTQSWVLEDRERILWLLGHRPAEEIRVLPGPGEVYQFRWETEGR